MLGRTAFQDLFSFSFPPPSAPLAPKSSRIHLKFSLYGRVQQYPVLVSGSPVNHMSDPCPDGWDAISHSEVLLFLLNFLCALLSKPVDIRIRYEILP